MHDMVRPEEYAVIKTTLPLIAYLSCTQNIGFFKQYRQLPPEVRQRIDVSLRDHYGLQRFEIYRTGEWNQLLVLEFRAEEFEDLSIVCVGDYRGEAFAEKPEPVTMKMLEKMGAMSRERWSLRRMDELSKVAWWQWALMAATVIVGPWYVVLALPRPSIARWLLMIIVSIVFILIPLLQIGEDWLRFRKQRERFVKMYRSYFLGIPQNIPLD